MLEGCPVNSALLHVRPWVLELHGARACLQGACRTGGTQALQWGPTVGHRHLGLSDGWEGLREAGPTPTSSTSAAAPPQARELKKYIKKIFLWKYNIHTEKRAWHKCTCSLTFLQPKHLCKRTQIRNESLLAP